MSQVSTGTCGFVVAWVGPCANPDPCPTHAGLRCISCGAPATRECPMASSLICGASLCDGCHHDGPRGRRHVPRQPAEKTTD